MFIEILGLWGLLIFLFVGVHECELFNLVNFQAPLLCGLGPKLQGPMILTPLPMGIKDVVMDTLILISINPSY